MIRNENIFLKLKNCFEMKYVAAVVVATSNASEQNSFFAKEYATRISGPKVNLSIMYCKSGLQVCYFLLI